MNKIYKHVKQMVDKYVKEQLEKYPGSITPEDYDAWRHLESLSDEDIFNIMRREAR